jgi:hypothetical protein
VLQDQQDLKVSRGHKVVRVLLDQVLKVFKVQQVLLVLQVLKVIRVPLE